MLDESMFEDIHEIAENSAYLKAVEEKDVSLEMLEQLPPYDELRGLEEKLRFDNKLTFDSIFNEPTGYYMIKCFLIADYAVDKAIFIKDVEAYKSMRFESARRKVALLLYQRFVATDETPAHDFKQGSSVFQIIQSHKGMDDKSGMVGGAGGGGVASSAPMSGGGMGAKGFDKSDNGKGDKTEKTVVSSNLPSQSNLTQMSATAGHGMGHGGGNGDEFGGGAAGGAAGRARNESTFQMGTNNNPIGVYGRGIRVVKDRVMRGEAPKDLFDEVARDVMTDLKLDVFPRFLKSDFYKKYIRTKWTETQRVLVKDFTTFRVLGRGGFGAVHACRKKNSGQIYAMKCINKKLVKVKSALDNVLEERNVLTMMKSNFVTNLKYALQDEDTLFLIMDLMCLTEDSPVIKADGSVVPVGKVVAGDSLCSRGGKTVKVLSNDPAPVSLLYEVGDAGGNDYRVSAEHVLVLRWDRDPWTTNAEAPAPGGYRTVKAMWFDVNMNFHERVVAKYFLAGEADPAALESPIPNEDGDVAILGEVTEEEASAHGRAYLAGLDKTLVWQAGAEVRMTAQAFYELWQEEGGKGAVQHLRSVLAPLPGRADADPLAVERDSEKQLAGDELSFQMREPKKIQLSDDETVNVMKIRVDGDHTFLQANGVVTHNCGGDLKFHLINAGRFTEKRARFYAAQVLLGLEHVHALSIIYRDMKLENVLLDHAGQCRLSDLGLAVVTKVKIKGYAGTPGYTAPEMIKNKLYGPAADIFSYGVMLYRMLCGSKPFKGKVDRDLDKAVIERKPQFPKEIFSKEAILLLTGLLQKRPENRMGCGDRGIEEIKESPFFDSIDWGLLEAGYIDPPFVPNKFDVNAASLKDIGDFDRAKYKHVKLDDRFKQRIKNFEYVSAKALQDEMVLVLEKADENVNFEKFAHQPEKQEQTQVVANGPCCSIA